jgi:hypothetical protein
MGPGERYTFGFQGRVESVVGGSVSVTVAAPDRWQVVAPQLNVSSPGGYLTTYTVTNLWGDAATAILEVPYPGSSGTVDERVGATTETQYHLVEGQKLIKGFDSASFTLRVDVTFVPSSEWSETVQGRVTTAGGGDPVFCPATIHYFPEIPYKPELPVEIPKYLNISPSPKVTGPGDWEYS